MHPRLRRAAVSTFLALFAGAAGAAPQKPPSPDRPAAACQDFYAYANADWLAQAEAVRDADGVFAQLERASRQRQLVLLEAAAREPQGGIDRVLGTFWNAALDETAIAAAGTGAIDPLLGRIDKAKKPRELAAAIAQAHAGGVPLLFRFGVGTDLNDPQRRAVYLRQGGLGLPDRDYYLREDPQTQAIRTQYRDHVARLLTLAGTDPVQAPAQARQVVELETKLARASLSLVQLRDPNNSYQMVPVSQAVKLFPRLELRHFFKAQGLETDGAVSLAHTAFFTEADALLGTVPAETWHAYLRFHLAHVMAPHLTEPFRAAHWSLFDQILGGEQARPDRAAAMLEVVGDLLGDALGHAYAQRNLDAATGEGAAAIARAVVAQLDARLAAADWLSAEARAAGRAKLTATELVIGSPESAPDLSGLELAADAHAANVLAIARWRQQQALQGIDSSEPPALQAHRVSAYYEPVHNRLAVATAFLQPPIFDPAREPAANYGALGALLAHELSHGFDAQGSKIDAEGRIRAWWTPPDYEAFVARTQSLAFQYDGYTALGQVRVDGRRTFLENVADLGGLELAFGAMGRSGATAAPRVGPHTAAQRFFLAWAELWRRRYDRDTLTAVVMTGVHPPASFRVLGPLANMPEFADAFDCTPGQGFVRAEAQRARLWN